jgi:hypothetical protein
MVTRDRALYDFLRPRKLFQFGMGADANYDPVCFDLRKLDLKQDCPVLQIDHEDIFQDIDPPSTMQLAESFHELVIKVISKAETLGGSGLF